MLIAPITSQISATSHCVPAWSGSRMQYRRRGPDRQAHRAEGQHHGAEPQPPGQWLATQPAAAAARIGVGHLAVQPGVHAPVDFLADALDESLGHGGVVAGAEITVCRGRGADFIPDAHAITLSADRAGRHWG